MVKIKNGMYKFKPGRGYGTLEKDMMRFAESRNMNLEKYDGFTTIKNSIDELKKEPDKYKKKIYELENAMYKQQEEYSRSIIFTLEDKKDKNVNFVYSFLEPKKEKGKCYLQFKQNINQDLKNGGRDSLIIVFLGIPLAIVCSGIAAVAATAATAVGGATYVWSKIQIKKDREGSVEPVSLNLDKQGIFS